MDRPLRFAAWTASHLAICVGVGLLGARTAFLRTLTDLSLPSRSFSSALSLSSDARTLTQRLSRPLVSGGGVRRVSVHITQDVRSGWGILAGNDTVLVLNDQFAVQHLEHVHLHPGVGRPFRARQQLKRSQSIPHGVVPGRLASVPEAQRPVQTSPSRPQDGMRLQTPQPIPRSAR